MNEIAMERPKKDARAYILLRRDQLARWKRIAYGNDLSLSDFIRQATDRLADELESTPPAG